MMQMHKALKIKKAIQAQVLGGAERRASLVELPDNPSAESKPWRAKRHKPIPRNSKVPAS